MTLEAELLDLDSATLAQAPVVQAPVQAFQTLSDAVDDCQRQKVRQALSLSGDNWASAARMLGLDSSNLHKLARRLGLK